MLPTVLPVTTIIVLEYRAKVAVLSAPRCEPVHAFHRNRRRYHRRSHCRARWTPLRRRDTVFIPTFSYPTRSQRVYAAVSSRFFAPPSYARRSRETAFRHKLLQNATRKRDTSVVLVVDFVLFAPVGKGRVHARARQRPLPCLDIRVTRSV